MPVERGWQELSGEMATPGFLQKMGYSEAFPEIVITNRKAGGDAVALKFYIITLKDVRISSISRSAANGVPEITETITLPSASALKNTFHRYLMVTAAAPPRLRLISIPQQNDSSY
jgi:hypothetical protein